MINVYFADHRKLALWVEIQWTAWLVEGGIPLIAAYTAALVLTIRTAWKIAFMRDRGDLWVWGAVLFAYDWGILAFTFSYPVFEGQFGIEFWLLNAALYAASRAVKTEQLAVPQSGLRGLRQPSYVS